MNFTLGEEHQKILDCDDHVLVVGGPGSGKTSIALLKAYQRILKGVNPGERILFISFSRAAVARIVEASNNTQHKDLNRHLAVQTFHSFFWEVLRVHGYLLGCPMKLKLLLPHDEASLRKGINFKHADWDKWLKEREILFKEKGLMAFDLFAEKINMLFDGSRSLIKLVASRYPLIIVDEVQDTGTDQWQVIQKLSEFSRVLFLGDLEQQIYDFLDGVGPKRIIEIEESVKPTRFDLGTLNNRSPNTEILQFGNDILLCKAKNEPYKAVTKIDYNGRAADRDKAIRQSIGRVNQWIKGNTGKLPESIGILCSWDSGVNIVTSALRNGSSPISHKVLFDETATLLSSRFLAFLLEPKLPHQLNSDIAESLELLSSLFRSYGTSGKLRKSDDFDSWSTKLRTSDTLTNTKLFKALVVLIKCLHTQHFAGDPAKDWMLLRRYLKDSAVTELMEVERNLQYLMTFNRGKAIAGGLQSEMLKYGVYRNARRVLDEALAEDQLLFGVENLKGIHVMTIHKSKGKQFDGVILFRAANHSSFVWREDPDPYLRSRKILRVGITRARNHVAILNDRFDVCPILSNYKFQ